MNESEAKRQIQAFLRKNGDSSDGSEHLMPAAENLSRLTEQAAKNDPKLNELWEDLQRWIGNSTQSKQTRKQKAS